jgi:hypothetical protein
MSASRVGGAGPLKNGAPLKNAVPNSGPGRHPSQSYGEALGGRQGWWDLDRRLLAVLGRITERDRLLCRLLDDHRVLTSAQVADVGFTGERRARTRLAELYAMDVLDRFRSRTGGNPSPLHWVLGPLGAALIAAESEVDVADLGWRKNLIHDLAASQRLGHLEGINGFFTALMRSARTESDCHLEEWWSERRCAREWGEVVRPDAYGVWSEGRSSLPFLFEYDNGTERLSRLAIKLDGYAKLDVASGHSNWVLFSFPGPRREREARRVLGHRSVVVATSSRSDEVRPDKDVWLPVDSNGPRLRLIQLAEISVAQSTTARLADRRTSRGGQ